MSDHPSQSSIAGWPAQLTCETVGALEVPIYVVADLELRLDRHRLLNDECYAPPYFALLWSGSRELARVMAGRRLDLEDRSLLEVGCGLGLPALAAAAMGARVTALDREPDAIDFLRASAAAGGVELETVVGDLCSLDDRRFDHVVAAELLYEPAGFADLAAALVQRTSPGGTLWIADAARVDTRPFFSELARFGLVPCLDQRSEALEERTRVSVRIRSYRRAATR